MILLTSIKPDGTIRQKILVSKKAIIFCVPDKNFLDEGGTCTRIELVEGWDIYVSETLEDILKM